MDCAGCAEGEGGGMASVGTTLWFSYPRGVIQDGLDFKEDPPMSGPPNPRQFVSGDVTSGQRRGQFGAKARESVWRGKRATRAFADAGTGIAGLSLVRARNLALRADTRPPAQS